MLNYGCRAAQGKRVSLLVVKAWYMNGYEPVERDEVVQSVMSNMIWLEDSFRLARVWYIRDLGCPFLLYTTFGRDWDLMSQMCIYILLFIYICDDMNICYLLFVICYALVLFFGWRLSTERVVAQPLYLLLFPPSVIAIGGLQIIL